MNFLCSFLHPTLFLFFLKLKNLLLDFMCLFIPKLLRIYLDCLTLLFSILLRFKSSELSFTIVEYSASLFFLKFSSYSLCLVIRLFSDFSPSWLISFVFWSIRLLKAKSSSLLALARSFCYLLWRQSISSNVLASRSLCSCSILSLLFSAST